MITEIREPRSITLILSQKKTQKGMFSDAWRQRCEEEKFLRYLGPYFARAAVESRVDEFLGQAFHLWVDRFPLTHAPDAEPEAILWALEVEKKVSIARDYDKRT